MPFRKIFPLSGILLSVAAPLFGQIGIDSISGGPALVHDHVVFDFHIPVLGDPYPHEFKQGYAFDGVDLTAALGWHVGDRHLMTSLRVTPASRDHFAYDQDTDFEGNTNFTHGNAGHARSRTFGVAQQIPLYRFRRAGMFSYDLDFQRQWTRFNAVTTYDLNSNPSLPSSEYQRVISEQAIVYELRTSLGLQNAWRAGPWMLQAAGEATPISQIWLHNYIPVILAATHTEVYGFHSAVAVSHAWGPWSVRLGGEAGWFNSWQSVEGFRRELFVARLELIRLRH